MQDLDLIVGVLAAQVGFATPSEVLTAAAAGLLDGTSDSMLTRLERTGGLTQERRKLLEALAHQALAARNGDAHAVLTSLGDAPAVIQTLSAVGPASAGSESQTSGPGIPLERPGQYTRLRSWAGEPERRPSRAGRDRRARGCPQGAGGVRPADDGRALARGEGPFPPGGSDLSRGWTIGHRLHPRAGTPRGRDALLRAEADSRRDVGGAAGQVSLSQTGWPWCDTCWMPVRRWASPTRGTSSTATSSRPTSWWASTARRWSSIGTGQAPGRGGRVDPARPVVGGVWADRCRSGARDAGLHEPGAGQRRPTGHRCPE